MSSHPVQGSAIVPMIVRIPRTEEMSASEPRHAPAIRSLWPPTYLVSE